MWSIETRCEFAARKRKLAFLGILFVVSFVWFTPITQVYAAEPIIIGVPTSLGFFEGKISKQYCKVSVFM